MKPLKPRCCEFCERDLKLTFHHLVPKKKQKDRRVIELFKNVDLIHYGIWLCRACHKHVHKSYNHDDLAFNLNSLKKLLDDPEISSFVNWARRQTKRIK